jgi:hypothetical protein
LWIWILFEFNKSIKQICSSENLNSSI